MKRRDLLLLFGSAGALGAQKYAGPRPPKPDVPYLLHADNLVSTDAMTAKEESRKDDIVYSVEGTAATAKTPLASPIFLMQTEKLQAERMGCYKWEVRNGRREIVFSKKKRQTGKPLLLSVNRVTSDNLYRIEVVPSLEDGEYSLSPEGSNQVFCFQVY